MSENFSNNQDKIRAYKERNYIKSDFVLDWKEIEKFEEMRREKLKDKLNDIFKQGRLG